MSRNLKETLASCHLEREITPEEHEGLLSEFDAEDCDNGKQLRYADEECPGFQEHNPSRLKSTIVGIVRNFVILILGTAFLVPVARWWWGGMGDASQWTYPSRLLSNGTHEFKRTVLIVSIDGLR